MGDHCVAKGLVQDITKVLLQFSGVIYCSLPLICLLMHLPKWWNFASHNFFITFWETNPNFTHPYKWHGSCIGARWWHHKIYQKPIFDPNQLTPTLSILDRACLYLKGHFDKFLTFFQGCTVLLPPFFIFSLLYLLGWTIKLNWLGNNTK